MSAGKPAWVTEEIMEDLRRTLTKKAWTERSEFIALGERHKLTMNQVEDLILRARQAGVYVPSEPEKKTLCCPNCGVKMVENI